MKELTRLRGGRSEEPSSSPDVELRPCLGSVTISDIRLPLKVDYVCSTILETGTAACWLPMLAVEWYWEWVKFIVKEWNRISAG